ncbi:Uncharacterised protein [Salmonella sp. NCTC 11881]|nr:Uncharacterised protein [Salmonella sp. NCTC 11881]
MHRLPNANTSSGTGVTRASCFYLVNRQYTRQYYTVDIKVAVIKANRLFVGCRGLNGNMALNMRVTLCGIFQHSEVGENQRVGAKLRRHIHGALPAGIAVRMRKSINGDV